MEVAIGIDSHKGTLAAAAVDGQLVIWSAGNFVWPAIGTDEVRVASI